MTTEEIRNARKTFTAQLTNMIRDFESQTGTTIQAINVRRDEHKSLVPSNSLTPQFETISIFKGVYVATEKGSG